MPSRDADTLVKLVAAAADLRWLATVVIADRVVRAAHVARADRVIRAAHAVAAVAAAAAAAVPQRPLLRRLPERQTDSLIRPQVPKRIARILVIKL